MSAETMLEVRYLGCDDPVDVDELYDEVVKLVETEHHLHRDVAGDLRDAFAEGRAELAVSVASVRALVTDLSRLSPAAHFVARALGEDLKDTWIAEFRDGEAVLDEGPWDDSSPTTA